MLWILCMIPVTFLLLLDTQFIFFFRPSFPSFTLSFFVFISPNLLLLRLGSIGTANNNDIKISIFLDWRQSRNSNYDLIATSVQNYVWRHSVYKLWIYERQKKTGLILLPKIRRKCIEKCNSIPWTQWCCTNIFSFFVFITAEMKYPRCGESLPTSQCAKLLRLSLPLSNAK